MRRRTLGVKKEPTIMIIPMIDIVFFSIGILHGRHFIHEYGATNSVKFTIHIDFDG